MSWKRWDFWELSWAWVWFFCRFSTWSCSFKGQKNPYPTRKVWFIPVLYPTCKNTTSLTDKIPTTFSSFLSPHPEAGNEGSQSDTGCYSRRRRPVGTQTEPRLLTLCTVWSEITDQCRDVLTGLPYLQHLQPFPTLSSEPCPVSESYLFHPLVILQLFFLSWSRLSSVSISVIWLQNSVL